MSARDDILNADLPIDHPNHPFPIDRYRAMAAAEIELGHMTVAAGKASGNVLQERSGEVFLGLRLAVDDEENARLEGEREQMWAWIRGRIGNLGLKPEAREEGNDVPVR